MTIDIEIKVPITVSEAALGATIEVPTIDGRTLLKIPQGTRNGQKLRLLNSQSFRLVGELPCQSQPLLRSHSKEEIDRNRKQDEEKNG